MKRSPYREPPQPNKRFAYDHWNEPRHFGINRPPAVDPQIQTPFSPEWRNRDILVLLGWALHHTENDIRMVIKDYQENVHYRILDMRTCSNQSRRVAFVHFRRHEDAENCRLNWHGFFYQNRVIHFRWNHISDKSVYVGNLNGFVTEERLRAAFLRFGEIEFVEVPAFSDTEHHQNRKYGIVHFLSPKSASAAIRECSAKNFLLTRAPSPVFVKQALTPMFYRQIDLPTCMEDLWNGELKLKPRFAEGIEDEMANVWRNALSRHHEEKEAMRKKHAKELADIQNMQMNYWMYHDKCQKNHTSSQGFASWLKEQPSANSPSRLRNVSTPSNCDSFSIPCQMKEPEILEEIGLSSFGSSKPKTEQGCQLQENSNPQQQPHISDSSDENSSVPASITPSHCNSDTTESLLFSHSKPQQHNIKQEPHIVSQPNNSCSPQTVAINLLGVKQSDGGIPSWLNELSMPLKISRKPYL